MINYIDGDLIKLAKEGNFDVVVHGCNCISTMGAGIAPQMAKVFGCDKFEMELWGPTIQKLGNIDYRTFVLGENAIWDLLEYKNNRNEPEVTVVNAYTQNHYGKNFGIPFDYNAFRICLIKINDIFKGKHIGMPKIGAGLAGGDWDKISRIIEEEITNCKVTVVNYKP
jgi:O-acetyl-ADP-ribose deacetylase (regulator of RNase III)